MSFHHSSTITSLALYQYMKLLRFQVIWKQFFKEKLPVGVHVVYLVTTRNVFVLAIRRITRLNSNGEKQIHTEKWQCF